MIRTRVGVEGMMCPNCEAHVRDAVKATCKVKEVIADRTKNEAAILSKSPLDEAALRKAIEDAGYRVTGVTSEEE